MTSKFNVMCMIDDVQVRRHWKEYRDKTGSSITAADFLGTYLFLLENVVYSEDNR